MRNFTIFLATFLCLFVNRIMAQEITFEARAKAIANKIEQITKEEKAALKLEVESVNMQLQGGSITNAEADERKLRLAETRAKSIETRVAAAEDELNQLVRDKVSGKIKEQDSTGRYSISLELPVRFEDKKKAAQRRDTTRSDSRTTSQFVYSLMLSSMVPNGSFKNSNMYQYLGNDYEWGFSFTTRLLNKSNLLQAKYGLSLMYNNTQSTNDHYWVRNGDVTELIHSDVSLDHSRLRNVYLMVPLHLEFDFGKNKTEGVSRKQQGWRFGIGGYAGVRLKSKQVLRYEVDGDKVETRTKGDFNVNDFNYGLSSYIGYKEGSLYVKYDLQPVFESNPIDHNHLAVGIRWDFN
jgi:hypothetical protein